MLLFMTELGRKSLFRFRLRTIFLALTWIAILVGFYSNRAFKQRSAAEAVLNLGGTVKYDDADSNAIQKAIARCFGIDFAHNLTLVSLSESNVTDSDLHFLNDLRKLRHLDLSRTKVTDESLAIIGKIRSLETLGLNHATKISDEGIILLSNLDNLYHITLWNTGLADKGLESLAGLPKLVTLIAGGTGITDSGTECLIKSKSLRKVVFQRTGIGDKSLSNLSKIGTLESICILETEITDKGLG